MDGTTSRPRIPNQESRERTLSPVDPPRVPPSQRDPRDPQRREDEPTFQYTDYELYQLFGMENYGTGPDPDPGPSTYPLTFQEERQNQARLEGELGEDETTYIATDLATSLLGTDLEKDVSPFSGALRGLLKGGYKPDRNPPGGSNLDSVRPKKNNPQNLIGPSHQPSEYHGREQVTDHGRNLGSGRRDIERQKSSPSQPATGSNSEYHGRELVTDHGRNLGSGRTHIERQKSSPSQPATGSNSEYHGREQVTDHGRNLGSGQRHTERQKSSPSQPATGTGSKARKWEYVRNYMGREMKFEYEYDQGGRLVADGGFKGSKVKIYLCNHDLYKGSSNIKECGLTLWIQRAARTADYRGDATERLCLYEKCNVSKDRSINPGDVRIAFDESPARTPEHDPQKNAGYIHLKCLESHHSQGHRQMLAALNFKVEGRKPKPNDSLHRNPTIFGTIQEIVYIEDYLEQCRKDGEASPGGKATESVLLLSKGIEYQPRAQSKRARDIQRKILELEGFHNLESSLHKKYAEVVSPAETESTTQGQSPVISPNDDAYQPGGNEEYDEQDDRPTPPVPGGNQEHDKPDDIPDDPFQPVITDKLKQRPVARPTPPVSDRKKERTGHPKIKQSNQPLASKASKSKGKNKHKERTIVPPYVGKGKLKKRMRLDARSQEVWEEYEDPWSPLQSGDDADTKRSRKSKKEQKEKEKEQVKRKNKRPRMMDQNDGEGGDNVNIEAEGEDEGGDGGRDEGRDEYEGEDGGVDEDEEEIEKETRKDHQTNKRKRKRG